jgi:hypothetical protein
VAKKADINKTQAVANYLKAHSKAKASEIADALTKKGIVITPGHVANIKSKIKRRRRKVRAAKPIAEAATPATENLAKPSDTITLEQIRKVSQTVKAIGGFVKLRELLEVIREVGGLRRFKDLLAAMSATETDAIPF